MTVIDLNEIYKIIYYKYIYYHLKYLVSNTDSHLRPWAKNQGLSVSNFLVK